MKLWRLLWPRGQHRLERVVRSGLVTEKIAAVVAAVDPAVLRPEPPERSTYAVDVPVEMFQLASGGYVHEPYQAGRGTVSEKQAIGTEDGVTIELRHAA